MSFAEPWWLALLVLLALVGLRARQRPVRRLAGGNLGVASLDDFDGAASGLRVQAARLLPVITALACIALVVALARPQAGFEVTERETEGIAIAMVVDVSSSMSAVDLGGESEADRNRLEVVKDTFRDFIAGVGDNLPGRGSDLVSLVTFGRYADTLTPLTLDHEALLQLSASLRPVELPEEDGTAIGDAILAGLDSLTGGEHASPVLILLTDGSHNAGTVEPLVAAEAARALGVRIYAIGAGSRGRVAMPVRPGSSDIRMVQVFIDEFTLTRVAEATGGRYFRATDAEGLLAVYEEIDQLEKGRNVARHYQRRVDVYPLFLGLALILVLLRAGLDATVLRIAP